MDILTQYEKENPEQKQVLQEMYGNKPQDYGPIVSLVMRFSGGRIQNEQQANMVLISFAAGIIIISILILSSSGAPKGESREDLFPPGSSALSPKPIQ